MFLEVPANKLSIVNRSLVYGVGINDASYITQKKSPKKYVTCPYYSRWTGMLYRCYSQESLKKRPNYFDCYVCKEWLVFSNFMKWMKKQDWKDKVLDKDFLVAGNKVYSPNTCLFINSKINNLINKKTINNGTCKTGVYFDKSRNSFSSICRTLDGKRKSLGRFDFEIDAYNAFIDFKRTIIIELSLKQSEPLRSAMVRIAKELS